MKKRKKLISFVVAGALSFGMVGGTTTYATPNKPNIPNTESPEDVEQNAKESMNNLKGQLIEHGVTLPEIKRIFELYEGMDDHQKQKAKEILDQVKSGEMTIEEAEEQLKELGVSVPEQEEKDPLSE